MVDQHSTLHLGDVSLEPLSESHEEELRAAAVKVSAWERWVANIPTPDEIPGIIRERTQLRDSGHSLPYCIRGGGGHGAVGMTSIYDIDTANAHAKIGYTWLTQSARGDGTNTKCKFLLLRECFDMYHFHAVYILTNRLNLQSRRAIEKTGAHLDGIVRNHQVMRDGSLRDTCVYSIIQSE